MIFEKLKKMRLVPVIAINDEEDAIPLGGALIRGGLPCAEITFRTDAAEESIKRLSKEYPEMLIAAGTVLTTEQADRAIGAGATFIVAPGFSRKVAEHCLKKNYAYAPGVMTPTEIEMALDLGITTVKFFPAELAGGINMIKALAAPYTKLKFMPTGGISKKNIADYLTYEKTTAVGGSFMATSKMIANKEFDKIEALTKEAVEMIAAI
jgi:2-dehydro-3-deoxyphosphogluconate aldolase/(4S)-4-hydroxy-2-oxoglutarate aldolase